jgi:ATP-dependent Clp protease adaptor protein ClpS|tara:strand:- start:347 stop:676 length:330 start_codon:yes stop_codon:yes gene_type:complete
VEHIKSASDEEVIDRPPRKKRKPPKPPKRFKVIYHNDDFTPMEFVIWSLVTFFSKSEPEANSITLEIHKLGSALAGIYDYQIAESKVFEVMEIARENDYPLKVTGEPAD